VERSIHRRIIDPEHVKLSFAADKIGADSTTKTFGPVRLDVCGYFLTSVKGVLQKRLFEHGFLHSVKDHPHME